MSREAKHVLTTYRDLTNKTNAFIRMLAENGHNVPPAYTELDALVDDAHYAYENGDITTCLVRLEFALSSIHKLLLQFAPQGPLLRKEDLVAETTTAIAPGTGDGPVALVVDDHYETSRYLSAMLTAAGVGVVIAATVHQALKAIVDREFELVVTDVVMSPDLGGSPGPDGRELVIAARRSSKKTLIIVLTGYPEMSRAGAMLMAGANEVISKSDRDLPERVLKLARDLVDAHGR